MLIFKLLTHSNYSNLILEYQLWIYCVFTMSIRTLLWVAVLGNASRFLITICVLINILFTYNKYSVSIGHSLIYGTWPPKSMRRHCCDVSCAGSLTREDSCWSCHLDEDPVYYGRSNVYIVWFVCFWKEITVKHDISFCFK